MRSILVAFAAVLFCGLVGVGSAERCKSHKDCGPGRCCRVFLKGRKRSYTGVCEAYGTLDSVCHINPLFISNNVRVSCPCENGRECLDTGIFDVPNGQLGKCGPKSCETSADCAADECCVNPNRPIGRRRRAIGYVCQNMKMTGESCLVSGGSGQPINPVYICPCAVGLTCVANGFNDIPLGPLGICT